MASNLESVGEDAATETPLAARGGSETVAGAATGSNSSAFQVHHAKLSPLSVLSVLYRTAGAFGGVALHIVQTG